MLTVLKIVSVLDRVASVARNTSMFGNHLGRGTRVCTREFVEELGVRNRFLLQYLVWYMMGIRVG